MTREALLVRQQARQAADAARKAELAEPPMNITELVAEIEHMLRLNQGRGTIVHQLGYTGRETSLERRLQRAHRGDLIQALLRDDKATA